MTRLAGGFCLGWAMLAICSAAHAVEKATAEEAEQAATQWLEGHGNMGLTFDEQITEGSFAAMPIPGSDHSMAVLSHAGWYITLGFSGPITADMPLETVQEQLSFVALDQLPTPGLEVEGWVISPMMPTSSIDDKEAISITAFGDGKITLHVEADIFAIYGHDPSVEVPADAGLPPGSYFHILRDIPLQLTVEAPFTPQ